jgi:hypothetical protein
VIKGGPIAGRFFCGVVQRSYTVKVVVYQHMQRLGAKNCHPVKLIYMKQIFFIFSLIGLIQFSCTKSDPCGPTPTSLDGKWRMIMVKDNNSGSMITKPTTILGDVDIIFSSTSSTTGTFVGNTPTNEIQLNDYSVGQNQSLTIPNLSMTKVGETSWGNEFVNNIRSAQNYYFEDCDRLNIKTNNKTLAFQKQ